MLSSVLRQINQIKKENTASQYIPYSIHVDNHTIKTMEGDFLQVIKVEGIAHESADDSEINVWHEQFNQLLRNIASPNVAIWTHIIRREESSYPNANFNQIFAYQLNEKYKESLDKVRMFMNDLYVTIIYRPNALKVQKVFSKFQKTSRKAQLEAEKESLAKLYDTVGNVMSGLSRYEPTRLSVYEHNGFVYSDILEFLAYLVNGEYQRIPLPKAPLNEVLTTTRPLFGNEVIELRKFTETEYASMISIQEYPSVTWPGLFDAILTAPFELILTQSFVFMDKAKATDLMQVNQRRMISAGDLAQSQIYEISQALDDLTSNRFVMGEHHLTLMIRSKNLKFLNDFTSDCRTVFADTGMKVVREDLAIEASFWAQLPANFKMRPRPAPVTSRNFAGFSAFHNYPTGKRTGNHWGDAVALLQTASGSPYYFNFHKGSLGNTIIIGPSGSGKTVLQGFMLSMLSRYNATGVFFDKDRGAELVIRALGGRYLALKSGKATGFNPFHLEPNDANRLFMESLIRQLVASNGEKYNTQDMKMVRFAIDGVFDLPWHLRRLNSMRQFLDPTDPEGVSARLEKWCLGGSLAWVFDNEKDEIRFDEAVPNGFDITDFLDNKQVRSPILLYLFHRIEKIIDGRRWYVDMDEFWKMLEDEFFLEFTQNKNKTIRKQDGFLICGTQSPKDTLLSPISHTIIEQSATKIFLPNPFADYEDYVEGYKLSEREYQIIRNLSENSRRFLIKQGHNSIVAQLNLRGFDEELAILSGTTANVELLEALDEHFGMEKTEDPAFWMPIFEAERKRIQAEKEAGTYIK